MFPCPHCGWMPQDCPCAANRTTQAEVDRRHRQAVRRAQTARSAPRRIRALALEGEWLTGPRWTVAHQFRPDGTSHCGMVRVHDRLSRAGSMPRCRACGGSAEVGVAA